MVYPNKTKKAPMLQLTGGSGEAQAPVHGNQRIYSRKDTSNIITMAASASTVKDFLKLGRLVYDATKGQDARPAEYTQD